jgi:hypothetical protein
MMADYVGYPMLSSAAWGFRADTGLHATRLIFAAFLTNILS